MEKIRNDFEQWVMLNKELILTDVLDPFIRSGDRYIHERTQKLYEYWCSGYQRASSWCIEFQKASNRISSNKEAEAYSQKEIFSLSYALNKQVPGMYAIVSNYGEYNLDNEMKLAVEKVLTEIIKKRINEIEEETK